LTDASYTWRDSELQAKPLLALNGVGARLSRFGVVLPSLTPSSIGCLTGSMTPCLTAPSRRTS
jgi:hypothetical protein